MAGGNLVKRLPNSHRKSWKKISADSPRPCPGIDPQCKIKNAVAVFPAAFFVWCDASRETKRISHVGYRGIFLWPPAAPFLTD
jgi:hypothetical protein